MQFFKVTGILPDDTRLCYEQQSREERKRRDAAIKLKSEDYNQERPHTFCFLSDISRAEATVGIIAEDASGWDAPDFFRQIDLPAESCTVCEITLNHIQRLLSQACRNDYINDDDDVMSQWDLEIVSLYRRGTLRDAVLNEQPQSSLYAAADRYLLRGTLVPELDRIFSKPAPAGVYGHPVHYLIRTDERDSRQAVTRLLLQALYQNGRLHSRRYSVLNLDPNRMPLPEDAYNDLYKVSKGGTVVVQYRGTDNEDDGDELRTARSSDQIEQVCAMIRRYHNQVLTVLCLPRECTRIKQMFRENLGLVSLVELYEELAEGEQVNAYLKTLAKDAGVRVDRALFSRLEEGHGYLPSELRTFFDEWYTRKLKTKVFPQYKDVATATAAVVKAAPRGSAYSELQELIGLTEAKQVMQKALNYYKMQRIYEGHGIRQDTPALHMVFTGNPGTAKTTVARLFSRIMKENGLLSKGHLVEVGRSDLVGKYVGWTAPTVKKKFEEARGGVLFIDEAYSLTDDKNSFGGEAINTIVQEMENHRDEMVVIFAGYPDKMEEFLDTNPGLRSRIAFHVPFADYDTQELCRIATLMGNSKGIRLSGPAVEKLAAVFAAARKQKDFGNGRYVRNILEQARMEQASRLLRQQDPTLLTKEDVTTIRAEDIVIPPAPQQTRKIFGFGA